MGTAVVYVRFGCGRVERHDNPEWGWPVGTTHWREGDDGEWLPIPDGEKKQTSWPTREQYLAFWAVEKKYAEGGWSGKRGTSNSRRGKVPLPTTPGLYATEEKKP